MANPTSKTQEPLDNTNTVETECNSVSAPLLPPQAITDSAQITVPRAPQLEDVLAVTPPERSNEPTQDMTENVVEKIAISQDADLSRPSTNEGGDTSMAASGPGMIDDVDDGSTMTLESRENVVRKLYRHDCSYGSCPSRWSEFADLDEEQSDLTERNAEIPIISRHTHEKKHWIISSFTIQSGPMKDLFTRALDRYQDLDMELEDWTFEPPYRPIVHRWDRLKDLQAETTDLIHKQAADTLMEFLSPILGPSVDALFQTRRTGKISFEAIWQIFPPGELVMTKFFGVETVCRVVKYERQKIGPVPEWIITTEYVDWNGESCGYATTKTTIKYFYGFHRVTSLPVYPLSFNDAAGDIKSKMIERGRKFELLRGFHFLTCSGRKVLLEKPEERPVILQS